MTVTCAELDALLSVHGLVARGGFHPTAEDSVPAWRSPAGADEAIETVVLVGNAGSSLWRQFRKWSRARPGLSQPLDSWSREVLTELADGVGAMALFPFQGPPFLPFVSWAERSERLWVSPMGLLIHHRFGLWHAYRGALAFPYRMDLPPAPPSGVQPVEASPCDTCVDQPCLHTCPADALSESNYDVDACVDHLSTSDGDACLNAGCLARRKCPVGVSFTYEPAHANFHMQAFFKSQLARRKN